MHTRSYFLTLLTLVLMSIPLAAQGGKKGGKVERPKNEPHSNVLAWQKYPSIAATLSKMELGKMTFKINYKLTVPVADRARRIADYQRQIVSYNRSLAQRQSNLARLLRDIARQRDPRQRARQIASYQRTLRQRPPTPPKLPQLTEVKSYSKDAILRIGKSMIVRTMTPEPQFDNKGNLIPLTPATLKKMQGTEGYPGFPAQATDLGSNQKVRFYYLTAAAKAGKAKKKKGSIADILGDPKKKDALNEANLPEAVMVVILPNVKK